jgi:SAM-dependent methyltransferase
MAQAVSEYKKLIGPNSKKILEIGVGTGTLARLLKDDFEITGIDSSEALLKIAKAKLSGQSVKLIHKDILDIRFKELFDAAISHGSIFFVVNSKTGLVVESFLIKREQVKTALTNVYNALKKGGQFIFDYHPEHDPIKRFVAFDDYRYEFEIKENNGMKDFHKVHKIKDLNGEIIAESIDHKIRINLEDFKNLARSTGFDKIKTMLDKYLVLTK